MKNSTRITKRGLDFLLSEKEETLGEGSYGVVSFVKMGVVDAVIKVAHEAQFLDSFQTEAKVLKALNGAGGAPLLLAVCDDPPALVTTFAGRQTLGNILLSEKLSDRFLIKVLEQFVTRLQEIHNIGYVHNDIKEDNILVVIPEDRVSRPEVNIIDYGLACQTGDGLSFDIDEESRIPQVSPEAWYGEAITPASDVYSIGVLLEDVIASRGPKSPLRVPLEQLSERCMMEDPEERPSLWDLYVACNQVTLRNRKRMTPQQVEDDV